MNAYQALAAWVVRNQQVSGRSLKRLDNPQSAAPLDAALSSGRRDTPNPVPAQVGAGKVGR
jgi:hypothetical protein